MLTSSFGILGSKDYTKMPIQATSVTAQAIDQVKLPNNTISEAAIGGWHLGAG